MSNIKDIQVGDCFSETVHFKYVKPSDTKGMLIFKNLKDQNNYNVSADYAEQFFSFGEQYDKEIKVGKLDKYWTQKQINAAVAKGELQEHEVRAGDVRLEGMKTIWDNIRDKTVFTVVFRKKDTELSQRAYLAALEAQRNEFADFIDKAYSQKKGVKKAAMSAFSQVQNNPVLKVVPGELRTLTGYKTQFNSKDGSYKVFDMEIEQERQLNLDRVESIIINNVKYIKD